MSTNLSITKSTLAKLLAQENLNVVHKRISTAMFDTKTRTLYVPIWEDMNGELYDLLMGHEVGHAINTPAEGWHSATHDANGEFNKAFKSVLNVCEDARIEKLIKRQYPGLCKSFIEGYKILFERDFFGIKKLRDLSRLNLVDRINLYTKIGSHVIVPFNDEERELLREVENTETWDQVVVVAHKLFAAMKEDQEGFLNSLDDLTKELLREFEESEESETSEEMDDLDLSGEEEESSEEDDSEESEQGEETTESDSTDEDSDEDETANGSSDEESSEEDEEEDAEGGSSDDENEDEESDEDSDDSSNGLEGGDTGSNDPESITDRNFRERERELVADGVEVFTYNLPKPILDKIIVPHKLFIENFYEVIEQNQTTYRKKDPIAETCAKRFTENNNRYINLLVKEFEMRKNARQYARTSVAKTGELDMSKLHKYKYSNDLFRKISVVEKGKNHGMMMFVDMSGSMSGCFGPTMEQTLILVAFCRKVGIPFSVYGFCDDHEYLSHMIAKDKLPRSFRGSKYQKLNNDMYKMDEENFHLVHFIDSQLTGTAYRRAFEAMCIVAMNWNNKMYSRTILDWKRMGVGLGGTPFTQTVMASRPMIEEFKKVNKVDITNVIYLTDGDGTGCFTFTEVKPSPMGANGKPKIEQHIFLIDQKTKRRVELKYSTSYYADSQHQKAMTEFVRSVTGCKHIGFYVSDSNSARLTLRKVEDQALSKQLEDCWREHGYYSLPNIGYDMYYYVKASTSNIKDGNYSIDADGMSSNRIAKVFTKVQEDKRKNRVLVSKFAQDIAA